MDFGKLHIENFGPIKNADIELGRVNVFIGSQGVGKSVIGKLLSLLDGVNYFNYILEKQLFKDYILLPRFNYESQILFSREELRVLIKDKKLNDYIYKDIVCEQLNKELLQISIKKKDFHSMNEYNKEKQKIIDKIERVSKIKSLYIPEHRTFLSSITGRSINWQRNIDFDEYILDFLELLEKAKDKIRTLEAPFLNRKYEFGDSDFSINTETKERINLRQEASGIKNIMPILAICNYYANEEKKGNKYHFIIEEPELNLYPKTQVDLITYLIEHCIKNQHQLTITTHSPYMLTAINNLCMAYQAGQVNAEKTDKVVPKNAWLNPAEVSAYHVGNGTVKSIFNKEAGLIDSNEIDDASDDIMDIFDELYHISAENLKKV